MIFFTKEALFLFGLPFFHLLPQILVLQLLNSAQAAFIQCELSPPPFFPIIPYAAAHSYFLCCIFSILPIAGHLICLALLAMEHFCKIAH